MRSFSGHPIAMFVLVLLTTVVPPTSVVALDMTIRPSIYVPMADSGDVFFWGYGLGLEGTIKPKQSALEVWARFDTFNLPHKAHGTLVLVTPQLGAGLTFEVAPQVSFGLCAGGGAYLASKGDAGGSASGPWVTGGTTFRWVMAENLNFRGAVDYEAALGLLQGLGVWLGFELTGGSN